MVTKLQILSTTNEQFILETGPPSRIIVLLYFRGKKRSTRRKSCTPILDTIYSGLELVEFGSDKMIPTCSRVGQIDQIDQIDHDLDHLDPNLPV